MSRGLFRLSTEEFLEDRTKIANSVNDEVERLKNDLNYRNRKLREFIKRPASKFMDYPRSDSQVLDWVEGNVEELAFLSYLAENSSRVMDLKNSIEDAKEKDEFINKLNWEKNVFTYGTDYFKMIEDKDYHELNLRDKPIIEDVYDMYNYVAKGSKEEGYIDKVIEYRTQVLPFLKDERTRYEESRLRNSLLNREGKIVSEEDYEEAEIDYDNIVLEDITRRNVAGDTYHYYNEQDREIPREQAEELIRNGNYVTKFKGARSEGTVYNAWVNGERISKGEVHRNFNYPMQADMKVNIKMLRDLQKDLLSTDPWYMTTNTDEFRNVKTSISNAIKAMEKYDKYPLKENLAEVDTALNTMGRLCHRYSVRKENDYRASGKPRDFKRSNIANSLMQFASLENRQAIKDKSFVLNPKVALKKINTLIPENINSKDVVNYLRGMVALSKLVPKDNTNREINVGISLNIEDMIKEVRIATRGTELDFLKNGGMNEIELKELDKVYKAGKPTDLEKQNKVGEKYLKDYKAPNDEDIELDNSLDLDESRISILD